MSFRYALKNYIVEPQLYPDEVLFFDSHAVIIKDAFPKSQFHFLILPRDLELTQTNPVFLSAEQKNKFQCYVDWALTRVFEDFTKKYTLVGERMLPFENKHQFKDKQFFIDSFTQVGIHSIPSLRNLHIHVMTKDFYSDRMKNKKHYNSFNTTFFVSWSGLPLEESPDATYLENEIIKKTDLKCCYCKKNFKNRFSELKLHLDHEFKARFVDQRRLNT
ncbi:LAQU0S01e04984g1_1 [Lachancea quebecensis]|uniref:LAQU0S01e04984g1_1 n=1 Tax=Lachancea quebecensis TaxID=1654605 RepID=A0A0P1KMM4_9SACH|nr:LAQU0S01e04984g1_1 [Lachancea quebecensis]